MSDRMRQWVRPLRRAVILAAAAGALAGCVVVPYGPRWHACYYCYR